MRKIAMPMSMPMPISKPISKPGQYVQRQPRRKINGDDPSTWGEHLWISAHAIASRYPMEPTDEERLWYMNFFTSFGHVLPCLECRGHWDTIVKSNPLSESTMRTRESLCRWLFDCHNAVNTRLQKQNKFTWAMLQAGYDGIPNLSPVASPTAGPDASPAAGPAEGSDASPAADSKANNQTTVITYYPENLASSNIEPDKSLGLVKSNTPFIWRSRMAATDLKYIPPHLTQQKQIVLKGALPKKGKKCGCGKK